MLAKRKKEAKTALTIIDASCFCVEQKGRKRRKSKKKKGNSLCG
jgi:hypothetical protein